MSGLALRVALQRATQLLVARAEDLRARLETDPSLWADYQDTVRTLALIAPAVAPGSGGELLTTEQMARQLGISVKTLLRHKKAERIRPVIQQGKLLRWDSGVKL